MSIADQNSYQASFGLDNFAAAAGESERTTFIRRTYSHLAAAITVFILIEVVIFNLFPGTVGQITNWMFGSSMRWIMVLGGFMVVSWIADSWARSSTSLGMQYAGLGLYVVCEAIIFIPILAIAQKLGADQGRNIIATAGVMTLIVFAGLTMVVFLTRADFSWMGRYLTLFGFAALGFIVCALVFDMQLGDWFAAIMVVFAAGYILYYTSNVLHHYRLNQYVAAALALFAAVALLFWYILQLVMSRD